MLNIYRSYKKCFFFYVTLSSAISHFQAYVLWVT